MTRYPLVGVSPEELGVEDYPVTPVWFIEHNGELKWTFNEKWGIETLKTMNAEDKSFFLPLNTTMTLAENECLYLLATSLMEKLDALVYIGLLTMNPLKTGFPYFLPEINYHAATLTREKGDTLLEQVGEALWNAILNNLGRDSKALHKAYDLYVGLSIARPLDARFLLNRGIYLTFHEDEDSQGLSFLKNFAGTRRTSVFDSPEAFTLALNKELTKLDMDAITARQHKLTK